MKRRYFRHSSNCDGKRKGDGPTLCGVWTHCHRDAAAAAVKSPRLLDARAENSPSSAMTTAGRGGTAERGITLSILT